MTKERKLLLFIVFGLFALLALGAAGLVAFTIWSGSLSRADRRVVENAIALARRTAHARDTEWQSAIKRAANVSGSSDECPMVPHENANVPQPNGNGPDLKQFLKSVRAAKMRMGESNELVIDSKNLATTSSPLSKLLEKRASTLENHLADPQVDPKVLVKEAGELTTEVAVSWDLIVLIDAKSPVGAVDESKGTFEARSASGHAYVYDYDKHRIACAGDFTATNSAIVHYTKQLGAPNAGYGEVASDLDREILETAHTFLRAVH